MSNIKVIKSNGERELLSPGKIISALKRSGADDETAKNITDKIAQTAWSGIKTHEIYKMAYGMLRKAHPALAARYSLRDAIIKLGPAGFEFEKYIMLLFRAHGYKTSLPEILQGKCITHEIDVMAERNGKTAVMECKLRHASSIYIGIKDTMATWARFLDLKDGGRLGRCPKIDEIWLVTNTRFSGDSQNYGDCKKMIMLSWNSPKEHPLPAWIDSKKLYPVTVLHSLKKYQLKSFSQAELLLLQDVIRYNINELTRKTGLPKKQLEPIVKEIKQVLAFEPKN